VGFGGRGQAVAIMRRMAAYDLEALTTHPLDYRLSGGPVLFWSLEVLRESTEWLSAHG